MCGRFTISKKIDEISERFNVDVEYDIYKPVYNAAPSRVLPIITNENPKILNFYRWGLIPFWAKDKSIGNKMINTRAESIIEKPAIKKLAKTNRCLVITDGFYEWSGSKKDKMPYFIHFKDNSLFAFAGIWDKWKDENGQPIYSFSIITTEPNELMKNIHNRMPLILNRNDENIWLNCSENELSKLLKPFSSDLMEIYPVSTDVNNPSNDFPELMNKVERISLF